MSLKISRLPAKPSQKQINPKQGFLDLSVDKSTEIQGIGMGVLSDGTPFLNQRGLARLCGVENAHIGTISSDWNDANQKPRITAIKELLAKRGETLKRPHIVCKQGLKTIFAYPDVACLAILEYYAFEAANFKQEARDNFRLLAGKALRDFIYTQVGYDPANKIPLVWQQFHDRVSLSYDRVPDGYFSIFKEMADIIVTLIQGGAQVGPSFLPDISMGQHWGRCWTEKGLAAQFGERVQYMHDYPSSFAQALSNPQTPWAYPDAALPYFRKWAKEVYIKEKLPEFLKSKAKQGQLPPSFAQLAIKVLSEGTSGTKVITQAS
ncbi:hypothetical protein [Mesorhizobium sp. M0187]|uniref:hypothetical protein n=1 Tax=Mesorhizobium sp. M0187 TaxID=2956908 RepID=UPI003338E68D